MKQTTAVQIILNSFLAGLVNTLHQVQFRNNLAFGASMSTEDVKFRGHCTFSKEATLFPILKSCI